MSVSRQRASLAVELAGRCLGLAAGLTMAVLSIAFLLRAPALATGTLLVFLWLALLGLAGAWLGWWRRRLPLAVVFMLSFIPMGVYLLGARGWLRIVGLAALGLGIAAGLLWWADRLATGSGRD